MKRIAVAGVVPLILLSFAFPSNEKDDRPKEPRGIADRYRLSLFVISVGDQKCSGFLVAQDPPLVCTIAHVPIKASDPATIVARLNEKGTVCTTRALHIHADFKEDQAGKKPYSPDLSIIELTALPDECGPALPLFRRDAHEDFRGLAITSLGFPFYTTMGEEGESAEAIVRSGHVRRMLDYDGSTRSSLVRRPMFEHSLEALDGESGSPLLNANGEVVAIHHGTRRYTKKSTGALLAAISVAIHVDELWRLLDQNELAHTVIHPRTAH